MTTTNIYLSFNGNCEEAFLFYKSVFGDEFNKGLLKKSEVRHIRSDKTKMYSNTSIRRGGEGNEEDDVQQTNKHLHRSVLSKVLSQISASVISRL